MQHEFWLLEEEKYLYTSYREFVSRKDAPIHISDNLLRYFNDTLSWVPTYNPALVQIAPSKGLNWYGPTIINQTGGGLLHQICISWVQIFMCGPEHLILRGSFGWQWPFEEQEHIVQEYQLHTLGEYEHLEIDRSELVQTLTMLANFGKQAATSKFFILHIGI